jgi:hypothetical protein
MFTCWMDAEAIGVGLEGGSTKDLEEWMEPKTDEVGLDAMRGERSRRIGSRLG